MYYLNYGYINLLCSKYWICRRSYTKKSVPTRPPEYLLGQSLDCLPHLRTNQAHNSFLSVEITGTTWVPKHDRGGHSTSSLLCQVSFCWKPAVTMSWSTFGRLQLCETRGWPKMFSTEGTNYDRSTEITDRTWVLKHTWGRFCVHPSWSFLCQISLLGSHATFLR